MKRILGVVVAAVVLVTPVAAHANGARLTIGGGVARPTSTALTATMTVSLAMTDQGPQIYESGHVRGWSVSAALFTNATTYEQIMGPIIQGRPSDPEDWVRLNMNGTGSVSYWTKPGAAWQLTEVLFAGPHREAGAGDFFILIQPWPAKPPTLHRIFTYSHA